jgi:hypothetical protein
MALKCVVSASLPVREWLQRRSRRVIQELSTPEVTNMGKPKAQAAKGDDGIAPNLMFIYSSRPGMLTVPSTSASNLVLSYLHKTNRPYSATDIANNLHNAVTKTVLQKILQQLVEAGDVHCKTQGTLRIVVEQEVECNLPFSPHIIDP